MVYASAQVFRARLQHRRAIVLFLAVLALLTVLQFTPAEGIARYLPALLLPMLIWLLPRSIIDVRNKVMRVTACVEGVRPSFRLIDLRTVHLVVADAGPRLEIAQKNGARYRVMLLPFQQPPTLLHAFLLRHLPAEVEVLFLDQRRTPAPITSTA
jgi:hypothetical protein